MIVCWFYRRFISGCIDTERALPEQIERHVRRCAACRAFYDTGIRLADRLIAEASQENVTPPPFLHGKILASLDVLPHSRTARIGFRPAWLVAVGIVFLMLIGLPLVRHRDERNALLRPNVSSARGASDPIHLLAAASTLPNENKLLEWSQKADQPLETELKCVIQDARAALAGLAHNFLPRDLSTLR